MVVPHGRSVGSTRLRDRHVTNPKGGYSALFFSCTSCMGTSTSKVGETETGRGGHGKGATKMERRDTKRSWSDGNDNYDGYKTTTKTRTTTTRGRRRRRDNYEDNGEWIRSKDTDGVRTRRSRPERRRISLGHVKFLDCSRLAELCLFFPFL